MRSDPRELECIAPRSLRHALEAVADGARPLAGGTDVMVLVAAGKLPWRRFVSLWGLPELHGIEVADGAVTLGALTTYSEVQEHALCARELPMLAQAGAETGGIAIQNRGTLGGNIANASPAADSPPALLAYGAEIELLSLEGARWVPYRGFHTGYKQTVMRAGEVISRIRVPRVAGPRVHFFRKVGPRLAQAISKVCLAACAVVAGGRISEVAIGMGAVGPVPLLAEATAAALRGQAPDAAAEAAARAAMAGEVKPIDDVRSTARYRRKVAENLAAELVRACARA